MNQEVPQPTTATRSPGAGSAGAATGASATACDQHSGWLAISATTWFTVELPRISLGGLRVAVRYPLVSRTIVQCQCRGTPEGSARHFRAADSTDGPTFAHDC